TPPKGGSSLWGRTHIIVLLLAANSTSSTFFPIFHPVIVFFFPCSLIIVSLPLLNSALPSSLRSYGPASPPSTSLPRTARPVRSTSRPSSRWFRPHPVGARPP